MRLFISIDVPNEVKEIAYEAQVAAKYQNAFLGRWIAADNLHITLAFLGEIVEDSETIIVNKLKSISGAQFTVRLTNVLVNSWKNPRVLWIELESKELQELVGQINKELHEYLPEQQRLFKGHVTIAYIKEVYNKQALREYVSGFKIAPIEWTISAFDLQQSIVSHNAPIYNKLYTFKLAEHRYIQE